MTIKFRKNAVKFLDKAHPDDVERIREKLKQLLTSIEDQGVIPFTDLDIKKMKGDWDGFYRLRLGQIRIIFTLHQDSSCLEVYAIGYRGDVYK
jgi:mRNA interferase RelE/StbE